MATSESDFVGRPQRAGGLTVLAPETRVLLSDSLGPPEGYLLDRAVATTFSLNLASALAVPLAFAAREVEIGVDPISTIEAVRKVSNRVDIFCQAGQVSVPAKHSDLLSFLEPMVHPVKRPPRQAVSSEGLAAEIPQRRRGSSAAAAHHESKPHS